MLSRKTCEDLRDAGFVQDTAGMFYCYCVGCEIANATDELFFDAPPFGHGESMVKCPQTGELIDAVQSILPNGKDAVLSIYHKITRLTYGYYQDPEHGQSRYQFDSTLNLDEALAALYIKIKEGEQNE